MFTLYTVHTSACCFIMFFVNFLSLIVINNFTRVLSLVSLTGLDEEDLGFVLQIGTFLATECPLQLADIDWFAIDTFHSAGSTVRQDANHKTRVAFKN